MTSKFALITVDTGALPNRAEKIMFVALSGVNIPCVPNIHL